MNDKQKQQQNGTSVSELRDAVLARIEQEKVRPKSKWECYFSNGAMWFLWIVTVLIGAVALAELIYVGMHSGIEFFEVTHGNLAVFTMDSLPWIWLLAFIGMALLAYYNMRNTRRGYRYSFTWVVGSSLILTIIVGFSFHNAGLSKHIDYVVAETMPMYVSTTERQEYLWMHPEEGRMMGIFTDHIDEDTMHLEFVDIESREWILKAHELPPDDHALLLTGERVRLLGEVEPGSENIFYVCGVLPSMPSGGHTFNSIQEVRADVRALERQFDPPAPDTDEDALAMQPSLHCREILQYVLHKKVESAR